MGKLKGFFNNDEQQQQVCPSVRVLFISIYFIFSVYVHVSSQLSAGLCVFCPSVRVFCCLCVRCPCETSLLHYNLNTSTVTLPLKLSLTLILTLTLTLTLTPYLFPTLPTQPQQQQRPPQSGMRTFPQPPGMYGQGPGQGPPRGPPPPQTPPSYNQYQAPPPPQYGSQGPGQGQGQGLGQGQGQGQGQGPPPSYPLPPIPFQGLDREPELGYTQPPSYPYDEPQIIDGPGVNVPPPPPPGILSLSVFLCLPTHLISLSLSFILSLCYECSLHLYPHSHPDNLIPTLPPTPSLTPTPHTHTHSHPHPHYYPPTHSHSHPPSPPKVCNNKGLVRDIPIIYILPRTTCFLLLPTLVKIKDRCTYVHTISTCFVYTT